MNETKKAFLLSRNKFMSKILWINQGLHIGFVEHLLNTKKEFKNLKEIGDSRCIYSNKLDKGGFQNDMTY